MVDLTTSSIVRQTILTVAASLAYLNIGLVRGYSSSAIPSIQNTQPELLPDLETLSWAGSIPPVGALIGSLVSGPLMQILGRKKTVLIASPLWASTWTLLATASNYYVLLIGRFGSGFCVGLVLPASQVYVSECCAPGVRGRLGSLPSLFMSFGILLSYILGFWLQWRPLAWCSVAATCIIFVFVFPLPESPIWLSMKGKYAEAEESLKWLHLPLTHESIQLKSKSNDEEKYSGLTPEQRKEEQKEEETREEEWTLWSRDVLLSPGVLKPLGVGLGLLAFQQISGIDAVIFFTVEIFKSSGSTINNHLATIVVGLVQLTSNALSLFVVDRSGRRPLLIASGVITSVAMAAMGVAFTIDLQQHPALGYMPLVSLIVFMIGFSLGFGCIPFLLLGELFGTKQRGALSAIAGSFNLLTMFVVIKTYHSLQHILTSAGTFYMYAIFCAISVIFVIFCVPETKGKTLQEIEKYFKSSKNASAPTGPKDGRDNLGYQ